MVRAKKGIVWEQNRNKTAVLAGWLQVTRIIRGLVHEKVSVLTLHLLLEATWKAYRRSRDPSMSLDTPLIQAIDYLWFL